MAIIRSVPLKDATSTAMTSCGVGTAYDVGAVTAGEKLYGGLHILSSSTGALVVRIQGSSSSGFGAGKFTSHIAFTSQTSLGAQWATGLRGWCRRCHLVLAGGNDRVHGDATAEHLFDGNQSHLQRHRRHRVVQPDERVCWCVA
jgi:hypothetical protein